MDYKKHFSQIKDPKPISIGCHDKEINGLTSYKIIQQSNNIITASTTASNILSDTFHFKTKILSQKDLLPAYQNEISVKQPKAKDISKYRESIPAEFKAVFQHILNKFGNGKKITLIVKVKYGTLMMSKENFVMTFYIIFISVYI